MKYFNQPLTDGQTLIFTVFIILGCFLGYFITAYFINRYKLRKLRRATKWAKKHGLLISAMGKAAVKTRNSMIEFQKAISSIEINTNKKPK